MAKFFVEKNASFQIVLPFDCQDDQNPRLVFADGIEQYPERLKTIPEDKLEYHWCKFRRPDWGLSCYLQELAYDGSNARERVFSQEKLNEVRLRYLLLGSSFFPEENPISFAVVGTYQILSSPSEELIKQIDPFVIRIFLNIANSVWDLGLSPRTLLSEADYRDLRNGKEALKRLLEAKGLINRNLTDEEESKKKPLEKSV